VEELTFQKKEYLKVPAFERQSGRQVWILMPKELGNPGRIFESCPELKVVPEVSPGECDWMTGMNVSRVNIAFRSVCWSPVADAE